MSRFRNGVDAFNLITRHVRGAHVQKSDLGKYVLASDYAALEAENARLARDYQVARDAHDALLAQLAAIQQAKGEEVEVVVAVKVYDREDGYKLSDDDSEIAAWAASKGTNVWLRDPLVSLAQHQRITAAMAAEVERFAQANRELSEKNVRRREQVRQLRAELESYREDSSYDIACQTIRELRAELAAVKGQIKE